MPDSNVVSIAPKSKQGAGKNYKWFITYQRETQRFSWRVEFVMHSVLTGDADDYNTAKAEVDKAVKRVRS